MGANINLRTGKIIGTEKGSFSWWHEKAHLNYDNSPKGIRNAYLQQMWLYSAITLGILSIPFQTFIIWALSIMSIIVFWGYYIYEEIWCNNYATNKLKEEKCSEKN